MATDSANALGVWQEFMVIAADVYDALVNGTVPLSTNANVTQIAAGAITASSIAGGAITGAKSCR